MPTISKEIFAEKIDELMYWGLILFSLTFFFDLPINLLTIVFVLGLVKLIFIRPRIKIRGKYIYFIAAFLVLVFVSVLFNTGGASFSSMFAAYKSRFMSPIMAFLLVFLFDFTKKRIAVMLSCMAVVFSLNSAAIIWQHFIFMTLRPVGFCTNTMLLAVSNIFIVPILLRLVFEKTLPGILRKLYLFTVIINIPAIIFSGTRIVWISLTLSSVITLLLYTNDKKKAVAVIITAGLIITGIFMSSDKLEKRFEVITDHSMKIGDYTNSPNTERILMWESSLKMIRDYPLAGVGIDNFHELYKTKYKNPVALETPWHPHNVFLAMAVESGFIGFSGFIALFVYLYYNVTKIWRKSGSVAASVYFLSLLSYNISFLTDSLFCGHYLKLPTYMFWFITAAYLAMSGQIERKEG
ncbi:O-antigen ligase family protein [Pectinatus frisingensis]|uniref:O-antigen ligase family protein n=1 Tax=Pectinatus frisingensis TaxID=865 RepID=UPI0015F6B5FD|nr:O-antigen ligase family protein [Pectinatus frisingensis]